MKEEAGMKSASLLASQGPRSTILKRRVAGKPRKTHRGPEFSQTQFHGWAPPLSLDS